LVEVDLYAQLASCRRHLAADEAGSHDRDPPAPSQLGPQLVRVGDLAQVKRVLEPRQLARLAAGGQEQGPPFELLAAVQDGSPGGKVHPDHTAAELQL